MKRDLPNINEFKNAYFIGVGGIGMSALARYFKSKNWNVGGYDKTSTPLTKELEEQGIIVHYEDLGNDIPNPFNNKDETLVVFTPAIPSEMRELNFVLQNGFQVFKRAEVLGMITRDTKALGVAGTHGKTTTSTLLAHILNESRLKCNAFLGGISSNFNSNFISDKSSDLTVIEADEFDRSFLQLDPFATIITSTDPDHLDIYGDNSIFLEGFQKYADLVSKDGFVIHHVNVNLQAPNKISYGIDCEADYSGNNLRFTDGRFLFDVKTPTGELLAIELGIPGIHNAENAIACIAMLQQFDLDETTLRTALKSFKGVKRRFEYQIRQKELVYIDDYAHHPTEIAALVSSIKLLYPKQKITGIFQPHLFTRTRDFFEGFADELGKLDEVILLPIYPAREQPIEGITSEVLSLKIQHKKAQVLSPEEAVNYVTTKDSGVILTIGAGDIDRIVEPIKQGLLKK